MGDERGTSTGDQERHDPYARRAGYATGVDGRTDVWTTAAVAGVVTGGAVLFLAGLLHIDALFAYPAAVVIGAAVWFVVRARRRATDRRAGRSPDEVPKARSRATAAANGGRRFFVAQNPVVVIVVSCIFIAVGAWRLIAAGPSAGVVVTTIALAASGAALLVQGIGTLVVRRRDRQDATRHE